MTPSAKGNIWKKKRHLRGPRWNSRHMSAGGIRNPARSTNDPSQVACDGCKRTVAMADAEARQSVKRNRFATANRRSNE